VAVFCGVPTRLPGWKLLGEHFEAAVVTADLYSKNAIFDPNLLQQDCFVARSNVVGCNWGLFANRAFETGQRISSIGTADAKPLNAYSKFYPITLTISKNGRARNRTVYGSDEMAVHGKWGHFVNESSAHSVRVKAGQINCRIANDQYDVFLVATRHIKKNEEFITEYIQTISTKLDN